LNISNQKHSKINGKYVYYYFATVNQLKYLELMINKNRYIILNDNLDKIKEKFMNNKSYYRESHPYNGFRDLFCKSVGFNFKKCMFDD